MPAQILLESGKMPDGVIRFFIRQRLAKKLREEKNRSASEASEILDQMRRGPVAVNTQDANDQHYELPPAFFEKVLGGHLKYSGGYWPSGVSDLNASEKAMLDLYAERAQIEDGQEILELGCGWGSLSLYLAEKFPRSRILSVSNAQNQRLYIEEKAKKRGFSNLRIQTANINDLTIEKKFDRIVSVEMFEHMRNYQELLRRAASWLKPEGRLFVHIFCHRKYTYFFTHEGKEDWMGKYFFTGGVMPSFDIFSAFRDDLRVIQQWAVDGTHYEKTSNAWLKNMDQNYEKIQPVLQEVYGKEVRKWRVYWRVFFMACAELFGYQQGKEWLVGHYLLEKTCP